MFTVIVVYLLSSTAQSSQPGATIGSKKFTESVILGEIITQLIQSIGAETTHIRELGGTRVLWNALLKRMFTPKAKAVLSHNLFILNCLYVGP